MGPRLQPEPAPPPRSPAILKAFVESVDEVCFVQIGANDGRTLDPLAAHVGRPGWRGVMVEPVPHIFEVLQQTHGSNPSIALERAAIGSRAGRRSVYHLRPDADAPGLPPWRQLVGSFDREHVLREIAAVGADRAERLIERTEVETLTFRALCERHGIENPNLVMVDAEGADWEIVGSIDLHRFRPRLLVFEHKHLSPGDQRQSRARLTAAGYRLHHEGLDTWCMDTRPRDRLSDRWQRLLSGDAPPRRR